MSVSNRPKVLFVNLYMHHKNFHALTYYTNIDFDVIDDPRKLTEANFGKYQYVYSPAILLDVRRYPWTKFMFGPHVSVFPTAQIRVLADAPNAVYIQPSDWARDVWANDPLCRGVRIETLPFGVDAVNRFYPSHNTVPTVHTVHTAAAEKKQVFIYFKRRHPAELAAIKSFFSKKGYEVRVFDYVQKYDESDYVAFLRDPATKFGVWIGTHESQGFALLEALAINVPLLVWDATSMSQEYGANLPDHPCTTAPYWDGRCGEKFVNIYEFEGVYETFEKKLESGDYSPRKYILENLTMGKCKERFLSVLQSI